MSEAPRAPEVIVRLAGVAKRFLRTTVFDGLDLDVTSGETLALLGRSGSGKTVLLRLILGLIRPDRGAIWCWGENICDLPEARLTDIRRRVGMVFQGGALFDSLTVRDNVAYALVERGVLSTAEIEARVAECLATVDLDGTQDLLPSALSGGMRKRVAIARAVAPAPELLLYDEPTTGLDPATAASVLRLIGSLKVRLGVTSIVVTHDMTAARAVADRLAVLEAGRVAWVGPTAEAERAHPQALARFLGTREEEVWPRPAG